MNKMIREIYSQRYSKVIWIVCILIVLFYVYTGYSNVNGWQSNQKYLFSEDFVNKEFKLESEDYVKDYTEDGQPIYYHSLDEYRKDQLTLYNQELTYLPKLDDYENLGFEGREIKSADSYQPGFTYLNNIGSDNSELTLMVVVLFILGFLLFFLDQKTNFNRFLFSLAVKRKKLFSQKILFVGLPLTFTLALSILMNVLINYYGIPNIYLNATLAQLLYSGFSQLILLLFVFSAGCFFGVLLGNLVFGPLALLLGLSFAVSADLFYTELVKLIQLFSPNSRFLYFSGLFISYPQKSGSPWYILLILVMASLIFIALANKIFNQISLENDGHFITVPHLQLAVFLTMFILSSIYFSISSADWLYFIASPAEKADYANPLISCLTSTVICFIGSFLLIYFGDIHKHWIERREMRLRQKII
ncbi:MAG TPA: hypothetical protein VK118_02995 [Tetragenococcus sp.]|nr:hypothetical protein [Tetragenococcus sp.]